MSGHSKWKTIRHKKEASDQKRGQIFSKLINTISIAARTEPNPQFNARLRAAVEKAKENKVPQENIERAIKRASEDKNLEELIIEAYGPEGAAILIEAITDNKNRTIAEIKKILSDNNAKFAEAGGVRWAFEQSTDKHGPNTDQHGQDIEKIPRESALAPLDVKLSNGVNQRESALIGWQAKFKQKISEGAKQKLRNIVAELESHDDVQGVYTNINF